MGRRAGRIEGTGPAAPRARTPDRAEDDVRILETASTRFLGSAVVGEALARGHEVVGAAREPRHERDRRLDLVEAGAVVKLLIADKPRAVIHCAALADIAPCAAMPRLAQAVNALAAGELAGACDLSGARLVHVSTDQVFDGSRGGWTEDDRPEPLHEYGRSKLAGEADVLERCPGAVVVRPGLITGRAPAGRRSSTSALLEALARGARPRLFTDEVRSPVAAPDVARALLDLVERPEVTGLLHCGGPAALTRHELGLREARAAGLDPGGIDAGTREESGLGAERPADLSLDSSRLVALLGWEPRTLA
jgi:dTDP-4-dehydrorhamnose reductase